MYKAKAKIILIARKKDGRYKMSIRSKTTLIPPLLKKALEGVEGYGGGHENACGACVEGGDFEKFISNLRNELK